MGYHYLSKGAKGLEVARIQSMLNAQGANPRVDEDGQFGPKTDAAVRRFQECQHLGVDGIVGPRTMAKLNPFRKADATGVLSSSTPRDPTPAPKPITQAPSTVPKPQGGTATPAGQGWIWQVQANGQGSWTPWAAGTDPSTSATWSGALSLAYIYRTKKDGFHIEAGPVIQGSINSRSSRTDPLLSFSGQYQVTFADIWAPGSFHILSPFLQAGVFVNADPGSFGPTGGVGDQLSYELIDDKLSLFVQPSLVASWNLTHGGLSVGPQVAGGVIFQW